MIPFARPGRSETCDVIGERATRKALQDAWLPYHLVQQAFVGHVFGDSASGRAALHRVGPSGIPIVNVNNNCARGSSALWLARQAMAAGAAECVLALGFEEMRPGRLTPHSNDRPDPLGRFFDTIRALQGCDEVAPREAQYFGGAAPAYVEKYGARPETIARVAVKARRHAANNANAVFRTSLTEQVVLASPACSAR